MLFVSYPFLVLLGVAFGLYYLPPLRRAQPLVLIVASFVFYAYHTPWLLLILVLSCLVNAVSSYGVFRARGATGRRAWAVLGVSLNLGLLLFFKYAKLLYLSLALGVWFDIGDFVLAIPLPIGISFFTFQGISLVVDTFRARAAGDPIPYFARSFWRHLYNTTLFKSFFPQLIAGPIVKAHQFLPQIAPKVLADVRWDAVFRFLVTGYFLKMVVADNLKDLTIWIASPYFLTLSSANLLGMLFAYSMQIFADFAGYSLIALGLGELFGYRLPTNFDFPYVSRSFAEFWTRWHMSLSSWLREYLYIPLGGNRKGRVRTYVNLFTVMFLGGLWHGAAWSYAAWGTVHGAALALERMLGADRPPADEHALVRAARIALVFSVVSLAWLLFKLPDFADVLAYLGAIAGNTSLAVDWTALFLTLLYALPVVLYHLYHLYRRRWPDTALRRWHAVAYGAMLFLIATSSGGTGDFIYFQF